MKSAFRGEQAKGVLLKWYEHFRNRLKAPTLVLGADLDVSIPGQKLLDRAPQLFPTLADRELLKDCLHCPPTTDAFRRWLSERISGFLLAS